MAALRNLSYEERDTIGLAQPDRDPDEGTIGTGMTQGTDKYAVQPTSNLGGSTLRCVRFPTPCGDGGLKPPALRSARLGPAAI